jgi:hypothetical protein
LHLVGDLFELKVECDNVCHDGKNKVRIYKDIKLNKTIYKIWKV